MVKLQLHANKESGVGNQIFAWMSWIKAQTQKELLEKAKLFFLTMMMAVRRAVLVPITIKLSINQVDQMTPLVTPMAFRVSFNRSSFSRTMLFAIMDTE